MYFIIIVFVNVIIIIIVIVIVNFRRHLVAIYCIPKWVVINLD